jgi:hypothetical protein
MGQNSPPMTRAKRTLLQMSIAGAVGGIIGVYLARAHEYNPRRIPPLFQFSPGMLAAIALICLFNVYWSAAAKNSAPTQSSESPWSRQFHLITLNLAALLLILSVPGFSRRFLPTSRILIALGLLIEVAGIAFAIWARRVLGRNWSGEVRIATGSSFALAPTPSSAIPSTPASSSCISASCSSPVKFTP